MTDVQTLVHYCNERLSVDAFSDYCPNGLQVAGERPVRLLVSGVTASQALLRAAIEAEADAILVHHGWFWKGEDPCLVGIKGRRVRALMVTGTALMAYHLPLDAHPELGNNRRLADVLDIKEPRAAGANGLLWRGRLASPRPAVEFAQTVAERLGRHPLHISALDRPIQELAWCTGGAQRYLSEAHALGADLFISGEVSEQTTHEARELGIDYLAAGHHATERYGVQALGAHLAEHFGLRHAFIDSDNPV